MRQFITSIQIEEREYDDPNKINKVPVKSEVFYRNRIFRGICPSAGLECHIDESDYSAQYVNSMGSCRDVESGGADPDISHHLSTRVGPGLHHCIKLSIVGYPMTMISQVCGIVVVVLVAVCVDQVSLCIQ